MIIHSEEGIFDEKQALMVSPRGRIPTLRTAHFLKPTVNISSSINGLNLKLPFLPLCSESSWPISVSFNGWYDPLQKWPKWVNNMLTNYQYIWKQSGIYEALMGSTYKIMRNSELIFGVAERWCSDTSSFLFPWAEATVTLEDMLILGGFSVLGAPFSMPLEKDLIEIQEGLDKAMELIVKSRKRKGCEVSHCEWIEYFMDSGDDLEHEAFLSLWLSRCVLPGNVLNVVNRDNFSIAIYLARGIRIALAPPVLASLYRDLSLLKQSILLTSELGSNKYENNYVALTLWSPIQFVQMWAWERLPPLQPKPKAIPLGHSRVARWHGVNRLKRENIRWVIDGAGESFIWRPYVIAVDGWLFPEFYKDKAQWVLCNGSLSEEFESYARCLRVSELVGTDSIEAYLPHRVAMQFGMDQDLPQWIPKSNATPEIAWENYNRPVCDAKLYFPCRLFEADVTTRYLEWWEKSVLDLQGEIKGLLRGLRSSMYCPPGLPRKCYWGRDLMQIWRISILDRQDTSNGPIVAVKGNCLTSSTEPTSIQGRKRLQSSNKTTSTQGKKRLQSSNKRSIEDWPDVDVKPILAVKRNGLTASTEGNDPDFPPGFPPKCDGKKEMLKSSNMQHIQNRSEVEIKPLMTVENNPLLSLTQGNNDDVPPGFTPKSNQVKEMSQASTQIYNDKRFLALKKQCLCSSAEDNGDSRMTEEFLKTMGMTKRSEGTIRTSEPADEIAYGHETRPKSSSIQSEGGIKCDVGSSFHKTALKDLEIEVHINLFEKVLAQLKAARSGCRCVKQEPQC